MALRVWLPLNGTLENKGISDVTVTNKGATVDNNGKIGKCYSFDGTDDRIYCSAVSWSYPLSISGWFYPTNIAGTQTQYFISYNTDNGGTTGHIIGIGTLNGGSNLYVWAGGSNYSTGITLSNNIWYHLAVTIDINKNYKFYLNGELKVSGTCGNNPSSKWITIGARSNSTTGAAGSASYYFKGKANDVRIYDHCLSAKEIKEISQGLVLHYKLDGLSQGSGNNLVTGLTKGGQTTVVNNTIVTSGQNSDTYFKIVLSSALELNKSYTMGIDAENLPDGGYFRFPIGSQSNSSAGYINIYNGHNEAVFIANDVIVNCGTSLMMDDTNRTAWPNQCIFKNFYIYENTSITDSSGYDYNGTITGTLTTQQNSDRYNVSTYFNGSSYITVSNPWKNGSIVTELTHTAWIKWNSDCSTSSGIHSIAGSNSFFRFSLGKSNKLWAYGLRSSLDGGTTSAAGLGQYGSATSLVNGQWYFIAVTFKNGVCKCYCDGELVGTADNSATYPALKSTIDNLYIGSYGGGGELAIGNVADSRMYCTALSAEDILDLYHTSANIDNEKRLHSFEFVEDNERDSIYKNGIVSNGKNINYLVNNFAETNTMTDWTFSSGTISNGTVTTTGTGPAITSKTFTVNPDDIVVVDFTLSMPTPSTSTSGQGLYLGTLGSTNTNRYKYDFNTHTWGTAQSNASSSWNTYFLSGYNSTNTVRIKTYILGSNVNIATVPDAYCSLSSITSTNAIQLTSGTITNIRAGYNNGNSTMVINLYDFKIYNLNQHGISQVDNSVKTGYGYLQYNDFIEK